MLHFGCVNLSQVTHYFTAWLFECQFIYICNAIIVIQIVVNKIIAFSVYLFLTYVILTIQSYILALVACIAGMHGSLYYSTIVVIPSQII